MLTQLSAYLETRRGLHLAAARLAEIDFHSENNHELLVTRTKANQASNQRFSEINLEIRNQFGNQKSVWKSEIKAWKSEIKSEIMVI